MPNQYLLDKTFLKIAVDISELSNCVSRKVGCVLVVDNYVAAMGYNGTPSGYINCHDKFKSVLTKHGELPEEHRAEHHKFNLLHEIHAEKNAMLYAARRGISIEGCTCYCTLQPCGGCVKELCQVKTKRIVFIDKYDLRDGSDEEIDDMAVSANISIEQMGARLIYDV
jgi:dCMP deaminase